MVIERDQAHFETNPGDGEGRAQIAAVEYGDRVFVTGEGDDRVFAAIERDAVQLCNDLVLVLSGRRLDSIRMRADSETLQVVRGTVHADDDVNRLRRDLG